MSAGQCHGGWHITDVQHKLLNFSSIEVRVGGAGGSCVMDHRNRSVVDDGRGALSCSAPDVNWSSKVRKRSWLWDANR